MKKILLRFSLIFAVLVFAACGSTQNASNQGDSLAQSQKVAFVQPDSISASDVPDGFAGVGFSFSAKVDSAVTVSTKKALVSAVRKGGVIFVDGMIDLSEGMLPETGGDSSAKLDEFVQKHSRFSNYAEYVAAYAKACSLKTEDSGKSSSQSSLYTTMHDMNIAYRDIIRLMPASNTVIIGLGEASGFFGGSVVIDGVSNVILRNLTILDAYDPFPHHESDDGYNAQHDNISVMNSKNVWIDHCTLGDTKTISHVKTGGTDEEKWQTYDGLCDITKPNKNVTVSYCKFMNHDKVMLIGSSDSEKINPSSRTVTLHHNYFYNCGQRLPMVRLTTVHSFNNYFDADSSAPYKSNYAIGVRFNSLIQSENNYFGSGTGASFSGHDSKKGTVYSVGDIDKSKNGRRSGQFAVSKNPLFEIPYEYATIPANEVAEFIKANAGAGALPVVR